MFQHDNAAVHKSDARKRWLSAKNIDFISWSAESLDLNPVENLWGNLARKVCAMRRQYENVEQLKNAIRSAWNDIDNTDLEHLILSMKRRIFEVILNNGSNTKY